MLHNCGMAETIKPDKAAKSKEVEEQEWRQHVLDELHRISRALEKIADRVGGMSVS